MRDQGIYGRELRRGTTIDGRAVVAMTRGLLNGQRYVAVQFHETDRKGRKRLSKPFRYWADGRVPGTRALTTWAMPAGPVGRKPGGKLHGGWYGDPDANGRGDRADRHSRKIDSLTYA